MSRVEINAGGRIVAIEGDLPLDGLTLQALKLWRDTEGPAAEPASVDGGAVGFHTELGNLPAYASAHQIDMGSRR